MTASSTPVWSDNVSIRANASLSRGVTSDRTTFDWRTKWGGFVFVKLARQGTTALTAGVKVLLRRTLNNDGSLVVGAPVATLVSQTAAVGATGTAACAASGNNAGVTTLTMNANITLAAGDIIYINGAGSGNKEWCRVAVPVTAGTSVVLDAPTKFAHNSTSDIVYNKADMFLVWLEGGATYEIVFDYGESTSGESYTIEATAQTLDSILTA